MEIASDLVAQGRAFAQEAAHDVAPSLGVVLGFALVAALIAVAAVGFVAVAAAVAAVFVVVHMRGRKMRIAPDAGTHAMQELYVSSSDPDIVTME